MTFSIVIMVGRGYFLPTHVHEASYYLLFKVFIYIFYGNFGSMLGQMAKKALEKPYITRLFEGAASFKLNRSRRFAGDVVEDSVDMRDFIDDP